jgi:hypothetical protein
MPVMNAVFWAIKNRASASPHNGWPAKIADVVTQPFQFSSFNANDPNAIKWPSPLHAVDWNAWGNAMLVVTTDLGGDPTNGCNSYWSGDAVPSWAEGKEPLVLGPFKFVKV